MKIIYKILIMGVICLLSNATYAQIVQYSDDGTKSCIDCEEKTATDSDCFCYFFEDIPRFHHIIAKLDAKKREEWLRGKEILLKKIIEDRLRTTPFNSYTEAQRAFFKAYSARDYSDFILDDLESSVSSAQRPTEIEKDKNYYENRTVEKLITYNNEGIAHKFGDLKMNGKYLRDIPNEEAVLLQTFFDKKKKEIADLLVGVSKILSGIPKLRQNRALEERIINDFINNYNSYDFPNRVLLMAKYLIWQNNGHILGNTPGNNLSHPVLFNPGSYDYTDVGRYLAFHTGQPTFVAYPQVTDDEAIASYAISTFGDKEFEFVVSTPTLLTGTRSYLQSNTYSEGALSLAKDLMTADLDGAVMSNASLKFSNYQGYPPNHPILLFHTGSNLAGNIIRSFNISDNAVTTPMDQFIELISTFNGDLHPNTEGSLIRQALLPQPIGWDPLLFTNKNLASIFELRGFTLLDNYPFGQLNFDHNIGRQLYNHGYTLSQFFQSDFLLQGALAIAEGDIPTAEHYFRVYHLNKTLSLDQAQTDWLIGNRNKAENFYNYYTTHNDAGTWSIEEVKFTTNAINVMMVNPNVNPFLGADCRSFEFAQPPGALQKGCAVKNFDHTFYTAGVRSNGSPYYGEIDVPKNLIYLTMPTWMTNGQAANLTAIAVTDAIKVADVYFFENPDVTKFELADIFRDAIKVELAIVGGTISGVEPFPIPSPAPYLTSVLGISNPFDCE